MRKKRKIVILLLVVIVFLFIISTIAFRVYENETNNVISFGSIKMQLLQTTLNENNDEIPVNDNESFNIMHNAKIDRMLKVKNLGKEEFYLRISLEMIGIDENNNEFDVKNLVTYDVNLEDWIYKDGYYYYKNVVKKGETTSNLITKINFDENSITSNYKNGKFKFNAKAEAVQAKNNKENVLEVVRMA